MKRRTFLGSSLTALGTATLLPAVPMASTASPKAGFWARYLSALHGSVPARQVAMFSGSTLAAATEAQAAIQVPSAVRRLAARALQEPSEDV